MFKARWRSDKSKIKAVFKLEFQASQIPQQGWNTIMVSLVPLDATKPTARSEKAVVVDGTCIWEKAIIETIRFSREQKSARIIEKVYRFVVSATDLPKGRVLGEATINFAEYIEANKPCSLSLPLKASNSNPILHVTIQRTQDDLDSRGEGHVNWQQNTLQNQLGNFEMEDVDQMSNGTSRYNSTEDGSLLDGHVQIKFSSTRDMTLNVGANANLIMSGPGSENGLEQYNSKETRQNNSIICTDSSNFLSPLRKCDAPQNEVINSSDSVTDFGDHRRSNTEWSVSSAPDGSLDGSTNSSEDTGARERLEGSDVSLEKLRTKIVILSRQVDVSELELQALRKQVLRERRQAENISKELCNIKEERDSLKRKCELLKASERNMETGKNSNLQLDSENLRELLEEMQQELNHEKNVNANLHLQLQKTQESNSELILAIRDLEELLEQKATEPHCDNGRQISVKMSSTKDISQTSCINDLLCSEKMGSNSGKFFKTVSEHDEDEELEGLVTEQDNPRVAHSLEKKIEDLNAEMELYKKDREDMEMQMEQLALDYEIVKQENHDLSLRLEQSQIREQLKMQYECSAHMSMISDLEAHVDNLERELEKQTEAFEIDYACVMNDKVEQEKKALRAEETLQKIMRNNASKAERLQQEFKMLSMQMSAAYDTNEKLAQQAIAEASDLRLQKKYLENLLTKVNEQLASDQYQYKKHIQELLRQIDLKTDEADQLFLKFKLQSQELENKKKSEEAAKKSLSKEILAIKVAMETLSTEKNVLIKQLDQDKVKIAEMEQLKKTMKENETELQNTRLEKESLHEQLVSLRNETKKSMDDLYSMRHLYDEKELTIKNLSSDFKNLEAQYNTLKHSLLENKVDVENTRRQINRLEDDVHIKDDPVKKTEEKMEDGNAEEAIEMKNKCKKATPHDSIELFHLQEKIRLLEEEIKMKDASLKESNHSLLRKDVQHKSDVGNRSNFEEELDQNAQYLSENALKCIEYTRKERHNEEHKPEKRKKICMCGSNGIDNIPDTSRAPFNSTIDLFLTSNSAIQRNPEELPSEVVLLKDKNISMEKELKEIQERYSEISLKFAEVEGERQQLVMTIRALKNSMKT